MTFGPTPNFTLAAGDEEIVGSADGPLLYRSEVNGQPAVVLTTDPEPSNLPKRVAFPVLIANIVGALAPDGIPAAVPLGEPLVYEPRAATAVGGGHVTFRRGDVASGLAPVRSSRCGCRDDVDVTPNHLHRHGITRVYGVSESDGSGFRARRDALRRQRRASAGVRPATQRQPRRAPWPRRSAVDAVAARQERVDLWPLVAADRIGRDRG